MVHRTEFESDIMPNGIRKGQVLRISTRDVFSDLTGFVTRVTPDNVTIQGLTGSNQSKICTIKKTAIRSSIEILTSPLFHRLRQKSVHSDKSIKWEKDGLSEQTEFENQPKPKMILRVPAEEEHKRVWHFLKIYP